MAIVKIREVKLVDQVLHFEMICETQDKAKVNLILTIDDNDLHNQECSFNPGSSSEKLELHINEIIHGKQLKIHMDDGLSCILLYSKLWPKVNKQYNYAMVKWINNIQKRSKNILKNFLIDGNNFIDEIEEL